MAGESRVVVGSGGAVGGPIWLIGWLFTIGFAHLHVMKAIFAIVIWPFYLGSALGH